MAKKSKEILKMKKKNIAIIGSGIAALSAAIRLAHARHRVTIFEANSYPGGKLSEFFQGAYRFDAGPSLFTMPQLVLDLLKLAGKKDEDFPFIKLEKGCHYFYDDGISFIAYHNKEKFAEELKSKLQIDSKIVIDYLLKAKKKYEVTAPLFIESSLHKSKTYFTQNTVKAICSIPTLNLFESMNDQNVRELKEPHLIQYFNRFATYNGSNPYVAPGILNMIPHLEHNIGSFFPKNGMIQITNSLVEAAKDLGVIFNFNQKVEEIQVVNNEAIGLKIKGENISFDQVVSNMDIYPTYKKLLPKQNAPKKILRQEKSSSAIIFYWGIKKQFDQLGLHNIFFSKDYELEFKHIFNKNSLYEDPTIYLNISSKFLPSDAPIGCENWFVMVNVPANIGQDWDEWIKITRNNILRKLSKLLNANIESLIENESVLDPRLIEERTSSFGGSLYGNASNNRQAAFLRHPNFSKKIKGLYFCGGSVHPGGGIPLCINSGKIVAQEIIAS